MSAKSRQCCIKASRSIAANIPSFFPHYCIFVLIYCCPCVTTLTWHRCSRNQNNRVRQKIPASVLDKCQNIFLYYYYLCVYVCVCVRKIHSSRGRREKKRRKKLRWKMIRLFQHLLKFFFLSLSTCRMIFSVVSLLLSRPPHFIILKLQAIFHVDRTSSILEAKDWNTFFSIYLFLFLCSRLHTVNKVE